MANSKIKLIKAREILDSRGNPTVEVKLETDSGIFKASVPSGASTGRYEAKALEASEAIKNINEIIAPLLNGKDPWEQKEIDNLMIGLDRTKNKSKLGANAILPVSIAVCRAAAATENLPLYKYINQIFNLSSKFQVSSSKIPLPCFNIINGGAHADNELDIQEFMVVPGEGSFLKNLETGKKIYKHLRDILKKETKLGDEGGFAPLISKTNQALDFLIKAAKNYPKTKFGLDCAASQFFQGGNYYLEGKKLTRNKLINFYQILVKKYPIIFIEDPFAEEDWEGWRELGIKNKELGILIIGDDLTVTNKERVKKVVKKNYVSGIIVKPNQTGTVSETLEAAKIAKQAGLKIMVSHRSGETMDDFIADLAVGLGADYIKSGAPGPKERLAKYNRLLEIEKELNKYI